MNSKIISHKQAEKRFSEMEDSKENRIKNKLDSMVSNEFRRLGEFDVSKVQSCGAMNVFRTRIGEWRVFFASKRNHIAILDVRNRDGAYNSNEQLRVVGRSVSIPCWVSPSSRQGVIYAA